MLTRELRRSVARLGEEEPAGHYDKEELARCGESMRVDGILSFHI
jgi:hypothetical protein